MYTDTTNVEPEIYDYTSNNWSHWNSNEKLKEKYGSWIRKTFDRFTTKDSYTWNITHNTESTAVGSLKPEWWGSPLVQERYREEKACDKRHPYRIIIIITTVHYTHTHTHTASDALSCRAAPFQALTKAWLRPSLISRGFLQVNSTHSTYSTRHHQLLLRSDRQLMNRSSGKHRGRPLENTLDSEV